MGRRPKRRVDSAEQLLGPLEYATMRAVWQGSPTTVRTVLERLNHSRAHDDALAYTTVMTVLGRLVDKGLLQRHRAGRGYEYSPRFSETELVAHMGQQEIAKVIERYGSSLAMTQFAVVLGDADPDLLRELIALAQRQHDGGEA